MWPPWLRRAMGGGAMGTARCGGSFRRARMTMAVLWRHAGSAPGMRLDTRKRMTQPGLQKHPRTGRRPCIVGFS